MYETLAGVPDGPESIRVCGRWRALKAEATPYMVGSELRDF